MAFASVGTLGSAASSANNQATLAITTSAAAEAGNLVVLAVAVDNMQTTDGDSTAVSGITDSAGGNTWTRAKGFANGQGTNQTGADISIWYSVLTNTIANGGTITATFTTASLADATAMSAWEYTKGATTTIQVEGTPAGLANDAGAAGSMDVTTANIECLRFRATATENSSTNPFTKTAAFTSLITQAVSGAGTANTEMGVRGEWLISTGTGQASAPTGGAGTSDHASAYVAFKEVLGAISGSVSATIAAVTMSGAGDLLVEADGSATISAPTMSAGGDLLVQATAGQTIPAITQDAEGSSAVITEATFNQTIDPVTQSAAGDLILQGSVAQTISAPTLAAGGDTIIEAEVSSTLAAVTQAAAGDLIIASTFSTAMSNPTLSASADLLLEATGGGTISPVTLVASGGEDDPGGGSCCYILMRRRR